VAKVKYRVKNWSQYNEALKDRFRLTLWLSPDVLRSWTGEKTGKRGAPPTYSAAALLCCLTIRTLLHLPLRGCQGFMESLLSEWLSIPDYTTMCRRAKTLTVLLPTTVKRGVEVHLVVDASGLKIYGEGEWKVRTHGKDKRRTWRKIHIGLDADRQEVLTACVTGAECGDGEMFPVLWDALAAPPAKVGGDGAYDTRRNWELLGEAGTEGLIPPRRGARIWRGKDAGAAARNRQLRRIRQGGRKKWKEGSGYHRRSLAETAFSRLKRIFGERLRSRVRENQGTEGLLWVRALNLMTMLGLPQSYPVN